MLPNSAIRLLCILQGKLINSDRVDMLQAQSAKLIGDAIQKNPAFLALRKIEVTLNYTTSCFYNIWAIYIDWLWVFHRNLTAAKCVAGSTRHCRHDSFVSKPGVFECWQLVAEFGESPPPHLWITVALPFMRTSPHRSFFQWGVEVHLM